MPAVTPEKWTDLPRLSSVSDVTASERAVRTVTTAPQGLEGEGFPVRRAFAGVSLKDLDPFVHMDQMGEIDYPPGEPKGTPWHPHRGFETVTYMLDGIFQHQDSHGGGGVIQNGATQWMTAGKGILHIETPPEELVMSGGLFHGIQLWVNLPSKDKMISPAYQGLEANDVVMVSSPDGESLVRIIAGDVGGHRGPGSTHSPMAMTHVSIAPGGQLDLPWDPLFNALVYVLAGTGFVGSEKRPIEMGQLATLGSGEWLRVGAQPRQDSRTENFELLVLGGQPIGEHVEHYGPFVMNTRSEIIQAMEDFQAGRLGVIPANALMPHVPDSNPIRTEHTGI
jgi:redox-sensitive bicupin YhaK (pirin superfamily)